MNKWNKWTYGLIVLVALTMIAPAVAIAESENGEHEGNEASERESGEREGNESLVGSYISGVILYVTLAAIVGIGSYSAFKVYQARKNATKKLV